MGDQLLGGRRELLVARFQGDVARLAVAAEPRQMVGPAEELVPERAGVVDDRRPRDEPSIGEQPAPPH